jgi:PqqD family protein of HPr-rel-A system
MLMTTTNAHPSALPGVSTYPLDDELVLYTPSDGQAYVLNHTAARIWGLLDGTRTETTVARELADTYGQEYDDVLGDVRELVQHLRTVGLLAGEPDSN